MMIHGVDAAVDSTTGPGASASWVEWLRQGRIDPRSGVSSVDIRAEPAYVGARDSGTTAPRVVLTLLILGGSQSGLDVARFLSNRNRRSSGRD